ncbi:MAG TPA: DUF167 domain-containing protein [Candidatus Paceibacterota bacterium]
MMERLIRVKVEAGARADSITENEKGFDITVRERAAENRANIRACELLATRIGVPVKAVSIVSGHHRPRKTMRIAG